ncbi:MAG: methylated-DNA--[protein]-cysteine S-methyltransferase [Flavitalea sp.]
MEVKTTYYRSPVGLLKISGTDACITAVVFADEVTETMITANTAEPCPLLINCTEQLIGYFHGQRRIFELPVDPQGTAFQKKVWHELSNIPFGKTISYLELSRRIGDAKAIRAVGGANGKNPIAIIIPCHRVIGANKELVGYSGGLWRKKNLLELEKRIAYGVQTLFD